MNRRTVLSGVAAVLGTGAGCAGGGKLSVVAKRVEDGTDTDTVVPLGDERVQEIPPVVTAVKQAAVADDGRASVGVAESKWNGAYKAQFQRLHSDYLALVRHERAVYRVYTINPE